MKEVTLGYVLNSGWEGFRAQGKLDEEEMPLLRQINAISGPDINYRRSESGGTHQQL